MPDRPTIDRAALRAAAEAATQGEWRYEYGAINDMHFGSMGSHLLHRGDQLNYVADPPDAQVGRDFAFCAAADPQTVLALLDIVDNLRTALQAVERYIPGLPGDLPYVVTDAMQRDREMASEAE